VVYLGLLLASFTRLIADKFKGLGKGQNLVLEALVHALPLFDRLFFRVHILTEVQSLLIWPKHKP
jgi:hypothetical protein